MKYVSIEAIEPGQLLGRTVFSANGAVLLAEDVQLTVYMINTLRRIGVTMLYIKDPNFADVEIDEIVSEESKRAVMVRMGEMMEMVRSGKEFHSKNVSVAVDRMLEEIVQHRELLVQLTDIRTKDNAMYVHAMNVSTIAAIMGLNLGLNHTQLKELTIGALLHDIGKASLEGEESNNPRDHHTWRGFEVLKNKREFSLLIAHVAFQHHETPDGKGVPRGVDGDNIHLYAKIVAVANMYDNLLFDLSHGRTMLPHEACEHMMALSGTILDREVLVQFMRIVSIYPNGTSVRLSNRQTGVVVGQHRGLPGRPVLRVIKTDDAQAMDVTEIDLAKETTIFIEYVQS